MARSPWPSMGEVLLSYNNLVHAVSGATGSVVGLTTFFPLDTVRTRLQVQDGRIARSSLEMFIHTIHEEGICGLYRGWLPVMSTLCCSNFVYFYVYHSLKVVSLSEGQKANAAQHLSFAFIAGVVNVLITTPLWVANTRLKLQGTEADAGKKKDRLQYTGMFDCLFRILQYEGLSGLWSGTFPSLVLVSNPAIQFMIYETLKRYMQDVLKKRELSGVTYFILGAVAKFVATVVTYPLQLIQTRWRAGWQTGTQKKKKAKLLETLQQIIWKHGWSGLYRGLGTKLTQTVLMAALMFLTYEKIQAFIFHLMGVTSQLNN